MMSDGIAEPGGGRLAEYGWDDRWQSTFEENAAAGEVPARVAAVYGSLSRLITEVGDEPGQLAGRLKRLRREPEQLPTVGDWVAGRRVGDEILMSRVLPRRTSCRRTAPGGRIQVVAANVEILLIVMGLDADFSPRRLERYLVLAFESGARPVVVLNKRDLCDDLPERTAVLEPLLGDVPMHAVCALSGEGLDVLDAYQEPARTLALLGSSGAGKSTLVNRLMGEEVQKTQSVRSSDEEGRHTTTHREIFRLPSGALLLDTPGLREIQLSGGGGATEAFADIAKLARKCRFTDCRHFDEPDCAVVQAVDAGRLPPDRLESYLALSREEQRQRELKDLGAARLERKRWKAIQVNYRKSKKKR